MIRSHKIRMYPNSEIDIILKKTCGCNRFAYNWMLNKAKENYENGIKYNKFSLLKEFYAFKKQTPFLNEVGASAVANDASDKLDTGFKMFFSKTSKHPKFKSKKKGICSFSLQGSVVKYDKDNKKVYLQKIGWIKLSENVRFKFSKIYKVTVTNKAGKWFVSFVLEVEDNRVCENQTESIGIDLGVKKLAVLSNGEVIENPRIQKAISDKLRRLNKELSRRTKDGKNWNKTVGKLRRLHERAFNTRQDYLHKFTSSVCRKYGTVCLEDLNVSGMVRNRKLSKHIQDASFSEIRRQFEYKAINGVKLVDRFFPSSKTCSSCGHVQKTPLNVRTFICNSCGVIVDRDLNAAMNIRTFAVGHTGSKKSVVKKALVKPNSLTKLSSGQETRFLNFV